MNDRTIREASADDADRLALIGAATFLDAFAGVLEAEAIVRHCAAKHSADAYRAALANGGQALLAEAEPGHAPVGFTLVGPPDLEAARDGDLELKRIYTLSRFHGTGLGGALMDAVIARANGFRRLVLGVYAQNHRALAFYRKRGFETICTRQFDVGGNLYDDEVLALNLSPLHSRESENPGLHAAPTNTGAPRARG
ncbi:MAG: N-acetyltransferase [Pontixanthobacter sp.]